jgi:hypothetical protein
VERLAVAQLLVALPFVGQILVRDFAGTADCVDKPDVFSQLVHVFRKRYWQGVDAVQS